MTHLVFGNKTLQDNLVWKIALYLCNIIILFRSFYLGTELIIIIMWLIVPCVDGDGDVAWYMCVSIEITT